VINPNPPFDPSQGILAVFLSWFLSQLAKVIRGCVREKRFNFRWLFDTGGMPSSHSATVTSLATVVILYYGLYSVPALMAAVYSLITMFDAAGVRRNVGKQATILNKMLDDFGEKGMVPEARVKELLGHTPVEVLAGAFVGVCISMIICH